jgi:hypothetical protein
MTLAELQRALTSVEPAAVLVPPRVMEVVIRQVLQLSAMVWSVPHRSSFNVDRTLLFRHVDQGDLALAPDQILPPRVILLSWPDEDDLLRGARGAILLSTWRQLFHASVHLAIEKCWDESRLTPALLREKIEALGPTAFEEIRTVLKQEYILLPEAGDRATFDEFTAVFLELYYFAPSLVPTYFPGLRESEAVKTMLDSLVAPDDILQRTRLPGAPEPQTGRDTRPSEANEYFHELEVSSEEAMARGNMVFAAIELQRAARVAPGDMAQATRLRAERILVQLLDRFRKALELPEDESEGWQRLLPILLDKADQGSRPAEAALLYELQKTCLDHEREIYKLDVVEWVLSAGRRPLRRPLPSQRIVRIARTLRAAMPNLTAARLSDEDRAELESLLQKAVKRSEDRVRNRFRPILENALQDVGLGPSNPLEQTAFGKMIEELLDRLIDYGFVSFGDLRDTISRNQLKLPDLADPQDFIRGDPLIRLDRRLMTVLDGVYRPADFYLRWLERFTSFNFGTKLGRALTRFVTLPVGGGWLLIELIQIIGAHFGPKSAPLEPPAPPAFPVDPLLPSPPAAEASWMPMSLYYSLWGFFGLVIFGLLHSSAMRDNVFGATLTLGRGLRKVLVDLPLWVVRRYALDRFLTSWAFQLFYWYVFKPAVLTLILFYFVPQIREGWLPLLAFFAANALVNTRPGEVFWESVLKGIQNLFVLLRSGLIPGIFRFIVRLYKQILHGLESVLFSVDEWLRFRGGESRREMIMRTIVTCLWLPLSYLARFNLIVFIEPCLHPLKLPVCSVAAKIIYPFGKTLYDDMKSWSSPLLGDVVAGAIAVWIVFWLPDVFGFIFWEMKENWTLYRANRRRTVEPVPVGPHGETVRRLFAPGFHSGALPKLFAVLREAELKALRSGNYSGVRHCRAKQQELEEAIARFVTREFCYLLETSPAWGNHGLRVGKVELASNQIRCHLLHPTATEPLVISFDHREGWVVAHLETPAWFDKLDPAAAAALHNALVLLYRLADVDLIREHLQTLLPSPQDHFDITSDGLAIWSADRQGSPLQADLKVGPELKELAPPSNGVLYWDPQRVVFSERTLLREACAKSWPNGKTNGQTPPLLLPDVCVVQAPPHEPPPPQNGKQGSVIP